MQKKSRGSGGCPVGGQGGCVRRIEVIVKIQKNRGDPVWGWSGGGGWLVARFGVVGDVGYGGCNPRIEVLLNVHKGIVQY